MNKKEQAALETKIFECFTDELMLTHKAAATDLSYHAQKAQLLEQRIAIINKRIELNNLFLEMKGRVPNNESK